MKLEGQVAIVTGAGRGIGNEIALTLAREGAKIAVIDLVEENVRQTVSIIQELGVEAKGYTKDLRSINNIYEVYEQIAADFGKITIVVNAAGVVRTKEFDQTTEEDWDFVMDINAKSTYFSIQQAGKYMKEAGGGRIVNISSIAGKQPTKPDLSIYGASKAAVISMTKTAASAFGSHGINVNAICPGFVMTKMWEQIDSERAEIYGQNKGDAIKAILSLNPKGRSAELNEIANLVLYLVSKESEYINGQSINICGGVLMD